MFSLLLKICFTIKLFINFLVYCSNKIPQIRVMELDLEKYDSVEKFAKDVLSTEEHIDFLVNNAGKLFFNFYWIYI